MKRTKILLAGVLAAIAGGTVAANAQAGASAHASRATEVLLRHTSLGSILETSSGFTLYEFTRDRGQRKVASGASRERNCSRVEAEAHDSLAQLTPDSIALDEINISRSSQTFVARHQDSVVCASYLQQLGAAHGRVRNNVSAEQPQPSRQSHQHPVNGESGSFVHCDRL